MNEINHSIFNKKQAMDLRLIRRKIIAFPSIRNEQVTTMLRFDGAGLEKILPGTGTSYTTTQLLHFQTLKSGEMLQQLHDRPKRIKPDQVNQQPYWFSHHTFKTVIQLAIRVPIILCKIRFEGGLF